MEGARCALLFVRAAYPFGKVSSAIRTDGTRPLGRREQRMLRSCTVIRGSTRTRVWWMVLSFSIGAVLFY